MFPPQREGGWCKPLADIREGGLGAAGQKGSKPGRVVRVKDVERGGDPEFRWYHGQACSP